MRVMRAQRPSIVLTLGGYASLACSLAAAASRVPIVVTEQNARAGLANRVAGRFARVCAVPFPETDLPRRVVTGNPVRDDVLAIDVVRDRPQARRDLGLPDDRTVVLVFSGSLGSRRINETVARWATANDDRGDLSVRLVVGRRDFDGFISAHDLVPGPPEPGRLHLQVVEYEAEMARALAAADLAVTRSGGTTVAELAVVGLPSILVPLPIAPRDHQTANADALVAAGGAVRIADDEFTPERLAVALDDLVGPGGSGTAEASSRLADMAEAAHRLGHRDAAGRVADLVEAHAH